MRGRSSRSPSGLMIQVGACQPPKGRGSTNRQNLTLKSEDDPAALESILAPDFLHVVGAGIVTKDEQLEYMRKNPAPHTNEQKHFDDMHVRVYGNVGIVSGEVVSTDKGSTRRTL